MQVVSVCRPESRAETLCKASAPSHLAARNRQRFRVQGDAKHDPLRRFSQLLCAAIVKENMQIQINHSPSLQSSEALAAHINDRIEHAMRHHAQRFSRIEVHLHDDNAGKHGEKPKRCVMEARPEGFDPITVEESSDDLYKAISETAKKLERAAQTFVERHR